MSRKTPWLSALLLAAGTSLAGCHMIDHKYWSLTVSGLMEEHGWPGPLRGLAFLLCDLPVLPFTFVHDVYAFFALPDRGSLPPDAPAPGIAPEAPEPPPRIFVRQVEPGPEPPLEPVEILDER